MPSLPPRHAPAPPPAERPRRSRIDLVLVGARGQVGSALRRRLADQQAAIARRCGLDLRLLAAFDRRGLAYDLAGLPAEALEPHLRPRRDEELEALFTHLKRPGHAPVLVVDCTASDAIAARYPEWLAAGLGVVTANKRANARELAFYRQIQCAATAGEAPYRFETTVGAAIPLLGPLRALALRGEKVLALQGVLSGSLSFLLERLHAGEAFSSALRAAQSLGYTEPDPGEDLRAEDLARKLLVLAREAGFPLEAAQLAVEPFSASAARDPEGWRDALADEDAHWAARIAEATAKGLRWVMLAEVDADGARIGLRALPAGSPFAQLPAGQNLVRIETELQGERPLWLGGPGAGPEVTAAGVLSDLIDAANELAWRGYDASSRRSVAA
jgi:aspartokinase/homoserine dehydrogenase 1